MIKRNVIAYSLLGVAWMFLVVWQVLEHHRVRQAARAELINRAKDISNTLGVVMRSQRRFGGAVFKDRLESALGALIKPGELNAIALLNDEEEVVASAGESIGVDPKLLVPSGEPLWSRDTVALMNLVDLGSNVTNVTEETERSNPTIILPPPDMFNPFGTNRSESGRQADRDEGGRSRPPPPPPDEPEPTADQSPEEGQRVSDRGDRDDDDDRRSRRSRRGDRRSFGRPFWMSEEEYQSLIQKQGAHSFVLVLSTDSVRSATRQDFWVRTIIGLAWRNLVKSSELELRLVRAAELNTRLKEMNLAAAGLAHETRNPLNIVRGLAQLISRRDDAPSEVNAKAREIMEETDRVTAQLNEFINYSKPREVRRTAVSLDSVVGEVARALGSDLEEKSIHLETPSGLPVIEGDEQLLRQALFNLMLNAIQAADKGGAIDVAVTKTGPGEATLDIRDNGPGVAPEHRREIFKPYFTTHQKGTGLGLAVVHQIVLAHGWEIECLPNEPRGAVFRITHIRALSNT
jgi:signal transduction histidine kinase